MKKIVRFIFALASLFAFFYLLIFFPIPSLIGLAVIITVVGIYDLSQKSHTILRNFPIIGHFRYLLEGISRETVNTL